MIVWPPGCDLRLWWHPVSHIGFASHLAHTGVLCVPTFMGKKPHTTDSVWGLPGLSLLPLTNNSPEEFPTTWATSLNHFLE